MILVAMAVTALLCRAWPAMAACLLAHLFSLRPAEQCWTKTASTNCQTSSLRMRWPEGASPWRGMACSLSGAWPRRTERKKRRGLRGADFCVKRRGHLRMLLLLLLLLLLQPLACSASVTIAQAERTSSAELHHRVLAESMSAASWYTGTLTGITDAYTTACRSAVADVPRSLFNYKRDPSIVFVADPVSPLCAKKCIRLLSLHGWPSLLERALSPDGPMDSLDSVGNPRTYNFGKPYGVRHPLSMRSLWHVADMLRSFYPGGDPGPHVPVMEGWRVAEIGAGAMCGVSRLLVDMTQLESYDVFELPHVGRLCREGVHGGSSADRRIRFFTSMTMQAEDRRQLPPAYDLVISTYSLSELDLTAQRAYAVEMLLPAKRLYIATNAPLGGNIFGEDVRAGSAFVPAREFSGKSSGNSAFSRGPFLRKLLRGSHPNLVIRPGYLKGANEVWVSKPIDDDQ